MEKTKTRSERSNGNTKRIRLAVGLAVIAFLICGVSSFFGGAFHDFCSAALPWIWIGIGAAAAMACWAGKKDK